MENQAKGLLMKSRSASACIKEGYGLYTRKFKSTLRSSWLAATVYAVICSVLCAFCIVSLPELSAQIILSHGDVHTVLVANIPILLLFVLLVIVGAVSETAAYSCVISRLKAEAGQVVSVKAFWRINVDVSTFWRTLKAVLANLLIIAILVVLLSAVMWLVLRILPAEANRSIAVSIAAGCAAVVIVVVTLPTWFASTKYLFCEDTRFWPLFGHSYATAMKHFGFILIVMLVSCIVIGVAEFVLALPAFIMSIANFKANMGVLVGDPLGMPAYIGYVAAVVFLVAGFIQVYLRMSALFNMYYMYGAIETMDAERQHYNDSAVDRPLII